MNSQNPHLFISGLSYAQRAELLKALLKGTAWLPPAILSSRQLTQAERWLWERTALEGSPFQRHSRARIWLIFMLIRHAGLRMREVLQLEEHDFRFGEEEIQAGRRIVPLSPQVASQLANFWANWPGRTASKPLDCDASFIRRSFSACARACGINPALLNPSSLRRQRGLELEAGGLHPHLASVFLGKMDHSPLFPGQMAVTMLRKHIKEERRMKTSARNVFQGQVTRLTENGILVSVSLETAQGLGLSAIITQASSKSLGLAPGVTVSALVKAPWVTVSPAGKPESPNSENCFAGKVEKINRDSLACEIMIQLPQGNQLCSLYANGASPDRNIHEGDEVLACFSPFAVILTSD
ncbi:MAG: TOBE domain-containing protein [Desulfovibrio sp.]|nr:TOBE domain-containing protein [Desulfovibrio sp.]